MVLRNVQPTFTFEEQRVEINELAADVDSISVGYNNTNWDTAFSWGNHATQNYIVNGTFSNVTINAGITTRNLTITDDGSASPIFVSRADDQSVWNLSLQNDAYSTNAGTGTKYFMAVDGTAKWYHYGYSAFENTEFYTARVVGSPSSYLAFRLDTSGGSQLMYQGNYRAGSTSWGLNVTGNLYASQGMDIPDGYAFHAGNSDDLRLGHNGVSSYIDNYTGALSITNYADDSDITLATDSGTGGVATYIRCDGSNGSVQLGHYGNTKLTTKSTGVDITGNIDLPSSSSVIQLNTWADDNAPAVRIAANANAGNVIVKGNGASSVAAFAVYADGWSGTDDLYAAIYANGGALFKAPVVSDPTATNVAGYAYEVKNGATSLGGLYKTSSNGGFLQLNNGAGTLKASINGEDGTAQFGEASANVVSINTDGKLTARNSSASATVVLATNFNGTDNFTVAANGTVNSNSGITAGGVLQGDQRVVVNGAGGKSGTQLTFLNYAGDASTVTASLSADGDVSFSGILQTNTKSAGNIELDSTGAFTSPPLKLYSTSGNIESDNPNGDTTLSIGDRTNNNGRLILTSKANTVEIHSRSNHPIEFLFNTTTKTKMTIDGGLNFEASGAGVVFDWQSQASGATSDKLDHYEEGTWTPTWGSTTGTITNITYNVQSGWYTRIGNIVYVTCRLRSTATDTSGAGGGLLVTGLPFVARNPQGTGGAAAYSGIDFPDTSVHVVTETRENTTQFYAGLYTLDNGSFGNIGPGSLQSSGNSEIRVSFFYMTDT